MWYLSTPGGKILKPGFLIALLVNDINSALFYMSIIYIYVLVDYKFP